MKHNSSCTMAFGRLTKTVGACPRCDELRNGAAPIKWNVAPNNNNSTESLRATYCFSVDIYHSRCTIETNPKCACGKMSYTD